MEKLAYALGVQRAVETLGIKTAQGGSLPTMSADRAHIGYNTAGDTQGRLPAALSKRQYGTYVGAAPSGVDAPFASDPSQPAAGGNMGYSGHGSVASPAASRGGQATRMAPGQVTGMMSANTPQPRQQSLGEMMRQKQHGNMSAMRLR